MRRGFMGVLLVDAVARGIDQVSLASLGLGRTTTVEGCRPWRSSAPLTHAVGCQLWSTRSCKTRARAHRRSQENLDPTSRLNHRGSRSNLATIQVRLPSLVCILSLSRRCKPRVGPVQKFQRFDRRLENVYLRSPVSPY